MDLSLSDAQEDLGAHLRHLLQHEAPLAVVRAAEPLGFDRTVWDRLVGAGIPGMGAPAHLGGGGADLGLMAVAAEELGRALAPVPAVEHAVAARVLARAAPEHPQLSAVTAGTVIAAFAPRPAVAHTAGLVPGGAAADLVVALDGRELVAVTAAPPDHVPANFASAPIADRDLVVGRVVLADGPGAIGAHAAAADEWRLLTAATLVGLAQGSLDLVVAYVKERRQFGVPIGSFQAIQHGLAELPGLIDGARLLVHEAAWSLSARRPTASGADGRQVAAMAFLFAGDVARQTTAACVQYHGGYGYTEEDDAQLFYRRARGWPLLLGGPATELQRLADLLLPPRTTA